jgi:cardiolipin synthase
VHDAAADRVLTVPNGLSALRIIAVPVFAFAVLAADNAVAGFVILTFAALTDYLDGVIARRFDQGSRLGRLLDPLADRLTSLVVPIVLAIDGILSWWLFGILLLRDAVVGIAAWRLARGRGVAVPVTFLGKAATFCLLIGLPLLLAGIFDGWIGDAARVLGWALTIWGTVLYWWSALIYLRQMARLVDEARQ